MPGSQVLIYNPVSTRLRYHRTGGSSKGRAPKRCIVKAANDGTRNVELDALAPGMQPTWVKDSQGAWRMKDVTSATSPSLAISSSGPSLASTYDMNDGWQQPATSVSKATSVSEAVAAATVPQPVTSSSVHETNSAGAAFLAVAFNFIVVSVAILYKGRGKDRASAEEVESATAEMGETEKEFSYYLYDNPKEEATVPKKNDVYSW